MRWPIAKVEPKRAREFLFATCAFSVAYTLSFVPIPATDFFWQVATGRFVLQHGVPHADPFSHTAWGRPWTAHEWLCCLLFALLFEGFSPEVTLKVKGLFCALAIVVIYFACRARGASQGASLLSSLLCSLVMRPFFDLRPQVLTYLLLSLLIFLSLRAIHSGPPWLPFLFLPLQSLWANIQGGFILGPVFSLLSSLGLLLTGRLRQGATFLALSLSLLVASFVNPYGPRHILYPLGYAGFKTIYTEAVVEWQPPDFRNPHFWPFEALLLLLLVLGIFSARKAGRPVFDLVLLLPFLHLALGVRKHVPLFALVASPTIAIWLSSLVEGKVSLAVSQASGIPARAYAIASLLLLLPLPFLPFERDAFSRYAVLSHFPVRAADFLQARRFPPRLFNPYDWGGYLIFRLWPKYLVFIDGRTDLYGRFVVGGYREALSHRWEEAFSRYQVGTAVVPPGAALFSYLSASQRWRLVYLDPRAAVFVRSFGSKTSNQTSTQGVE